MEPKWHQIRIPPSPTGKKSILSWKPQTLILKPPADSRTTSMLIFKLAFILGYQKFWDGFSLLFTIKSILYEPAVWSRAEVISCQASSNIYFLQKRCLLGNVCYLFVLVLERLSGTQETCSKART